MTKVQGRHLVINRAVLTTVLEVKNSGVPPLMWLAGAVHGVDSFFNFTLSNAPDVRHAKLYAKEEADKIVKMISVLRKLARNTLKSKNGHLRALKALVATPQSRRADTIGSSQPAFPMLQDIESDTSSMGSEAADSSEVEAFPMSFAELEEEMKQEEDLQESAEPSLDVLETDGNDLDEDGAAVVAADQASDGEGGLGTHNRASGSAAPPDELWFADDYDTAATDFAGELVHPSDQLKGKPKGSGKISTKGKAQGKGSSKIIKKGKHNKGKGNGFLADASFLGGLGTREQDHRYAQWFQPRGEIQVVLLGQYLGGCHERRLIPVFGSADGGEGRDHRLSRPYITLQQAQHGYFPGQVLQHFGEHPPLCDGEIETQGVVQNAAELLGSG